MPDAAQFTMTLFDTTALTSTLYTPAAEPVPISPALDQDNDDDRGGRQRRPRCAARTIISTTDRTLARGWKARARDNLAAIRLSKELEASGRPPTPDEQARLLRFVGFGATELAQNCFPLPGATTFRDGWEETGRALMALASPAEFAALRRSTQYAHFTPEPVVRALWRAARHLGFSGGRVLEPGMGTGLFFALLPPELRNACRLTGIEYDPITARIARLVHPEATVRCEDFTRSRLAAASTWPSATRRLPTASSAPIRRPRRSACGCMTISWPARSPGCGPAASPCSSPAPARWTRRAPRRASISPAWPTWWAPCGSPKAACAPPPAPTSWSTCWCSSAAPLARKPAARTGSTSPRSCPMPDTQAMATAPRFRKPGPSRSTPISPRIPTWCWARTPCGPASMGRRQPIPAARGTAPASWKTGCAKPSCGSPPTSSRRQQSPHRTRTRPDSSRFEPAPPPTAPRSRKAPTSSARTAG